MLLTDNIKLHIKYFFRLKFFKYSLSDRLSFLKKTQKKTQTYSLFFFKFFLKLFFFKLFFFKLLKINIYLNYFKFSIQKKLYIKKNYLLIILKKKKTSYILSSFFQKNMIISITLGCILKFFWIEKKSMKRKKKSFLLYINIFINFLKNFKKKNLERIIFINFFNFYLIFFWKKFKFLLKKDVKLFLNFNTHKKILIKKTKSIKKRLTKKNLKIFLSDWNSIKFNKIKELRYKS